MCEEVANGACTTMALTALTANGPEARINTTAASGQLSWLSARARREENTVNSPPMR